MPIPDSWIDKIFDKLTMVYGHQFIGRWSGLDLTKVKADWAHELDGLERRPHAIGYALEHLNPESPPTVLQFREICRRAPDPKPQALPAPEVNPEVVAKILAKTAQALAPQVDVLHRQREHMQMELTGVKLGKAQRDFWRVALRSEIMNKYGIDTQQKFSLDDLRLAMQARAA